MTSMRGEAPLSWQVYIPYRGRSGWGGVGGEEWVGRSGWRGWITSTSNLQVNVHSKNCERLMGTQKNILVQLWLSTSLTLSTIKKFLEKCCLAPLKCEVQSQHFRRFQNYPWNEDTSLIISREPLGFPKAVYTERVCRTCKGNLHSQTRNVVVHVRAN